MSDSGGIVSVDVVARILNRKELAEMLRTSTKTIDRHVDDGTLPKPDFFVGRQPRWKLTTVLEWTETRRTI